MCNVCNKLLFTKFNKVQQSLKMNFNKNYQKDDTSLKTFYKFVLKLIWSKIFITEYRIMKNLQLFKNYQIFQACLSTKFK